MEKIKMTKGMKKKVVAILTGGMMIVSMCVPTLAADGTTNTITVNVAIKRSALGVADIVPAHDVTLAEGSTALDALKIADGSTTQGQDVTIGGETYHHQGKIYWSSTQYGNYVPYVDDVNHSSTNKYFGVNGTRSFNTIASKQVYTYLENLNKTETNLGLTQNSTWNNTVHYTGLLSELDYNNYSGWMLKIGNGKEAPYYGVDTVLNDGDIVVLDFSMMMGLDVGLNGYMQDSNEKWVYQTAWN